MYFGRCRSVFNKMGWVGSLLRWLWNLYIYCLLLFISKLMLFFDTNIMIFLYNMQLFISLPILLPNCDESFLSFYKVCNEYQIWVEQNKTTIQLYIKTSHIHIHEQKAHTTNPITVCCYTFEWNTIYNFTNPKSLW